MVQGCGGSPGGAIGGACGLLERDVCIGLAWSDALGFVANYTSPLPVMQSGGVTST